MSKYVHTVVPRFTIYGIFFEDEDGDTIVFINKTRSQDLGRIFRLHKQGKHYLTAPYFQDGNSISEPVIQALEVLTDVTPSYAFRRQLAWIRRLDDEPYILLTHPKLMDMAYTMKPATEAVFNEVMALPLEDILANPPVIKPVKAPKNPCPDSSAGKTVQLNIRLKEEERAAFSHHCAQRGLSFREGFLELLATVHDGLDTSLISEQRAIIDSQAETIQKLTDRIKRGSRGANADRKLKEALSFCQLAIKGYLETVSEDTTRPMLPRSTWKRHIRTFPAEEYHYPEVDGFALIKLEAVCYGRGRHPAIFIWGQTEDTPEPQKIKLRFYEKRDFLGIPIGGNGYSYLGARFYVGYKVSVDGATDLYAAFPVPSSNLRRECTPVTNYPSLDERIRNAELARLTGNKI